MYFIYRISNHDDLEQLANIGLAIYVIVYMTYQQNTASEKNVCSKEDQPSKEINNSEQR